jgi:hypothetical protein
VRTQLLRKGGEFRAHELGSLAAAAARDLLPCHRAAIRMTGGLGKSGELVIWRLSLSQNGFSYGLSQNGLSQKA